MKLKKTSIIFFISFFSIVILGNILGIASTIIKSDSAFTARVGELFLYQIKAVDGFGSELTYHLLQAPDGMSINDSTGLIEWLPDDSQIGKNEIRLEIINNKYQRVLKLLESLSTEDEIKMDSSTIHEFFIEVVAIEEETMMNNSTSSNDCSEAESINWGSLFTGISGGG
jgi:hypothetical protein